MLLEEQADVRAFHHLVLHQPLGPCRQHRVPIAQQVGRAHVRVDNEALDLRINLPGSVLGERFRLQAW